MKKAIIGTVQNKAQADAIVTQLRNGGFDNKDISVIFPAPDGEHVMKSRIDDKGGQETKAADGAIAGAGAGGVFGGSLGLLAGIGALAIPGLGPFIAAGPIVATLTGLAAGATVGGFTGGLIGLASGRFSLGQVAVPVGVGIGVGTGVPIVTSVVTAVI